MRNTYLPLIAVLVLPFFVGCSQNESLLEKMGPLPNQLKEISATEIQNNRIWAVQDKGNKPELYALDLQGKLTHTVEIQQVKNHDWEELTSDSEGNLYIGDFGNNANLRKDLAILKIAKDDLTKQQVGIVQKTEFYYPEQTAFPPKKSQMFFDCEAFFEHQGYFYLFIKNRSAKFDGTTFLYKIPNSPGRFAAEKIGEIKTCSQYRACAITGADISPDGKCVALLTHDRIILLSKFKEDRFFEGTIETVVLNHQSQKEGIGFLDNQTIFITDEAEKKGEKASLYRLDLSKTKTESNK